jgi:rhamnosyltransferase
MIFIKIIRGFLRAKRLGCKVYVSPNIKMFHEIGDNNLKFLNWRIPVHSAHRRYYRIRNSFLLLNFPYFPKLAALREISFNIIHQLVLLIFCKHRVELFKSLVFGVRDGFLSFIKNK